MSENIIIINNEIGWGGSSTYAIRTQLEKFEGKNVKVEINSPGGDVYDGLEIFNMLDNYEGNVHTHVVSLAASMAVPIVLAGDKITAEETATLMIHNPWGLEIGDYNVIQNFADFLKGVTGRLALLIARKTGMEEKKVLNLMNAETYFFGEEALEFGLVDEIIRIEERENIENKDDSIAYAKIAVEECLKKAKSRKSKFDPAKAAALLRIEDFDIENKKMLDNKKEAARTENDEKIPVIAGEKNKKEAQNMDLEQLKRDHPGLYDQVFQEGKEEGIKYEKERVSAHLEWFEDAPEIVVKAIQDGDVFSQLHSSKYSKAKMNRNDSKNRKEDNPDDVDVNPVVDQDEEVKKMTELVKSNMRNGKREV